MKIKAQIGDLFSSQMQTLVNTVNCVGIMGKGVAQIFKKQYPAMFEDYAERCRDKEVKLGEPYHYTDLAGISIVNFPTKDHWRMSTRLDDVEKGLDHFVKSFRNWGVTSVAFPPLGCGNGGLEWSVVGPLIYGKLKDIGIPIELYAPYGTPATQLTEKFLSAPRQAEFLMKGKRPEKLRDEWVVLVEVLYELEQQPYANPIGRTTFQKICYILTKLGVDTGFRFEKKSYGSFANEVKEAVSVLANKNWISEQQLGRMTAIRVGQHFRKDRLHYQDRIAPHRRKIERTVDLFSRIKNTDQAEEVATVIFAVQELKKERELSAVSEEDLLNFILEWKWVWKKSEEKQRNVAAAIRNLGTLGWVKLEYSESLPSPE